MNYIVLDLEWNQDVRGKRGKQHEALPFEIIEIGAIKLDGKKNTVGQFHELIRPAVYKNMHHIIENMVHIKMEELMQGESFPNVIERFLNWCGKDCIFCSWGSLDLVELQRNMKYYDLPLLADAPFPFLDVQKLFSISFEDGKSRKNLEYATDFLHIEKDIPFHRAFSDAYYTAKVLEQIPPDVEDYCSYDVCTLPATRQEEVFKTFTDYSKYISREFENKKSAIADREVLSTKCYICNRLTKRKVKWFTPNGKHYYCISFCNKHGFLKGKIRIRKPVLGAQYPEGVYVVKTQKLIQEKELEDILKKRERAKMLRYTNKKRTEAQK